MQYDKPVESAEVAAALAADPSISANTRAAIEAVLDLENNTSIIVGAWDGQPDSEVQAPRGYVPDLMIVTGNGSDTGNGKGEGEAAMAAQGRGFGPGFGHGPWPGHGNGPGNGNGHGPGNGNGHGPGNGNGHGPGNGNGGDNGGDNGGQPGGPLELPPYAEVYAKAWVFNSDEGVDVTFDAEFSDPERVIAMGNGDDQVIVLDDGNTTVDGALGDDTIITSGGDDFVIGGSGNDSVSTGAGDDTIVSGFGQDTIDGGEGFDVVRLAGTAEDYQVDIVDGQIVLTNNWTSDTSVNAENVEFIQLSQGSIAVASSEEDATSLRLYQALLGRDVTLDEAQAVAEEGGSAQDLADSILSDDAFTNLDDEAFASLLADNVFGSGATDEQVGQIVDDLASGQDRATVAVTLVGTPDAADSIVNVVVIDGLV